MRLAAFIVGCWVFLASPSNAQELISPDAFLDIAVGKTLTFNRFGSGELVGTEEFLSRELSVWRWATGECVYGKIAVEGNQLCFYYEGDPMAPDCWWPFRDEDRLLVRFANLSIGSIQEVTSITDDTLNCPTLPTAGLIGEIAPAG